MKITNKQIKNTVLATIFNSDQYLSTREVSSRTGIGNDDVIEAVNDIKSYNELFLDTYKHASKENFLNVRVPEFIRSEVSDFLDNGGFISLDQNAQLNPSADFAQPDQQDAASEEKQTKGKSAKQILKVAGLIALITLSVKKSFTFFRK